MNNTGISVIICCYNAASRIIPTLHALQNQKLDDPSVQWEVLVIDNASIDNTSQLAIQTWNERPVTKFRVVSEAKAGLMHARRKGLQESMYNIVSYIDDDNWVEERWIEKIYGVFSSDEKIGACGGRGEAVFENECPDWFSCYENSFAVGKQMEKSGIIDGHKGFLWGAGLSFRKSIWEVLQNRGFTNLTMGRQGKNITAGEDTELCYAFRLLGYQLYYKDDLSLKHYMPSGRMQFSYLEKMNVGFGKAAARLNGYRVLLEPGFYLRSWWYEWLVAVKNIIVSALGVLTSPGKKQKWNHRLKKAYNIGYLSQVWEDKSGINKMIGDLKMVFKPMENH